MELNPVSVLYVTASLKPPRSFARNILARKLGTIPIFLAMINGGLIKDVHEKI